MPCFFAENKKTLSFQFSLSNSSYTIVILISITERRSVALTFSGFKSDSESFFFHKSPNKSSPLWLGFF